MMGDRGPSKRMTMADFLGPPPPNPNQKVAGSGKTEPGQTAPPETNRLPYAVRATKKGGVPCVVESRKHHKVVVLSNIEGDVPALLSALQRSLGTGGVRKGGTIEVQGEHHLERIRNFVLNSKCVVGASKQQKADALATIKAKQKSKAKTGDEREPIKEKPDIDCAVRLTPKAVKAMKPTELKEHLTARQLSYQGNKKELMSRLIGSINSV